MIEFLAPSSEENSEGNPINAVLVERLAKVSSEANSNGHHPEPWLSAVLSGEETATDEFVDKYLAEYRWIAALVADLCKKETGEDPEILMRVADDALLKAALEYCEQEIEDENYIDYVSASVSDDLREWFKVPSLKNPYLDPVNRECYSPEAIVEESPVPRHRLPGNRQPEDIELGSDVLFYVSTNHDGSKKEFLAGKISTVKRYIHRPPGYTLRYGDNPSPGLARIEFSSDPYSSAPNTVITDINNCLLIPKEFVRYLAQNETLQKQWFNQGTPQLSSHVLEEDLINELQLHVRQNKRTYGAEE